MGTADTTANATGALAIKKNAQTAQLCALGSNGKCSFCQRIGLPILPLRYAVIPNYLKGRPEDILSLWPKLGAGLRSKKLFSHKYTVRILRQGYVHVYLGTPGHWQVYAVTAAGHLRLLPNPDDPDARNDRSLTAQCASQGHNIPASFINISAKYAKSTVWIAFSQDIWPASIRRAYQKSPGDRMQAFDCSALSKSPDAHDDALEIEPDSAKLGMLVEEYAATAAEQAARHYYLGVETVDANRNDKIDDQASRWQSAHGTAWRTGELKSLGHLAQARGVQTKGAEKVAAIVLNDPVGIVQELNCMRMQYVNFQAEYSASVLRPQIISQAIVGLKSITENSALAARTRQELAKGLPDSQVETIHIPDDLPSQSQHFTYTTTRAQRAASDAAQMWGRLAKRYDEGKRKAFADTFDKRMADFKASIRLYDMDYSLWAEDPGWIGWLKDYDASSAGGCLGLVQMCAPCLAGGVVDDKSKGLWKLWLDSKKPGDPDNPVYIGLLAGQKGLIDFLLPDGLNAFPLDPLAKPDPVDKGDNTFDAIKSLMAQIEWGKLVKMLPVHASVAQVQLALGGAVSALGDGLSRRAEATALRAQQSAVKIYSNLDVTFLTLEMKLADYHKFLGQVAFKKLHSEVDDLVTRGSKTVKSIAISGVIAIGDVKLADTVVRVTLWTLEKAENVRTALHAAIADAKQIVNAGNAIATATLRFTRHALSLGHTTAHAIGALSGPVRMTSAQMGRFAKTLGQGTGKVLRVAGSADVVLAAGAVFFQAWSFRDGVREMQTKFGKQRTESLMGVIADGTGVIVGVLEITGKVMEAGLLGSFLSKQAAKVLKGGGLLAAGSSVVEGVQALMSAKRTLDAGDTDAGVGYVAAGALFMIGAGASGYAVLTGSTALLGGFLGLGPLGWAILLLAGAIIALWWAVTSEDSAAEIWLDRCYFGYGKRVEGKWPDEQFNNELAELNAVLLGLKAEVHWSDNWGMDGVSIKLTMPGFDEKKSAYEYTVSARHTSGTWFPVVGGRQNLPDPPQFLQPWDGVNRGPDLSKAFEFSKKNKRSYVETDDEGHSALVAEDGFLLNEDSFSQTRVVFKYWYDVADDEAVSTITHVVAD